MADERGSIISVTDSAGATIITNRYDEYGIPASTNLGRFQYTGQTWLAEVGLYHYKARMYSPTLGRFMQTDPIGYADGMNWYAYVGGDPVNFVDPLGLDGGDIVVTGDPGGDKGGDIVVTGRRLTHTEICIGAGCGGGGGFDFGGPFLKVPNPCGDHITNDPVPNPTLAVPTPGVNQGAPGYHQRSRGAHDGIDIANNPGSSVVAAGNGTVVRSDASDSGGYGGQIVIDHGGGVFSQYGHVGSRLAVGTRVGGGDPIGATATPGGRGSDDGNLGANYSPHLHFEIRMNATGPMFSGQTVDPILCLPGL